MIFFKDSPKKRHIDYVKLGGVFRRTQKTRVRIMRSEKQNDIEKTAALLGAIIYRETSKPDGEADMELVGECERALASLDGYVNISEHELKRKLRAITGEDRKTARRRRIKRISAAAACVVLTLGVLTITAYATVPPISDMFRRLLRMPVGAAVENNGVTYINNGETATYSSIDELVEAEGLSGCGVILPEGLPDELRIKRVEYTTAVNTIFIYFADGNGTFVIQIDTPDDLIPPEMKEKINGFDVYIEEHDGLFTGTMSYKGSVYSVTSPSRENIITVFEHMNKE